MTNTKSSSRPQLPIYKQAEIICQRIRDDEDCKGLEFILSKVFRIKAYQEMTRDEWMDLAEILDVSIQQPRQSTRVVQAFKKLVQRGYIYSEMKQGKRRYGLNYED